MSLKAPERFAGSNCGVSSAVAAINCTLNCLISWCQKSTMKLRLSRTSFAAAPIPAQLMIQQSAGGGQENTHPVCLYLPKLNS